MKRSEIFISIILLFMFVDNVSAETLWINNITINEYNISWNYTEIFTGMDSLSYRIGLDSMIGNNDSFINAWELLKADGEARRKFRDSIETEPDVRIDNQTSGIEIRDIDSSLSQELIGKTHNTDDVRNDYSVSYRLFKSIYNESSIWFLGEPGSPVTIVKPQGMDILNISGFDNQTVNADKIQGFFSNSSSGKGEITINFTKNASFHIDTPPVNRTEIISASNNTTKPAYEILRNAWKWIIAGIGIILVFLIYILKIHT